MDLLVSDLLDSRISSLQRPLLKTSTAYTKKHQLHKPTENDSYYNFNTLSGQHDNFLLVQEKISATTELLLNPKIKFELKGIFISFLPSFKFPLQPSTTKGQLNRGIRRRRRRSQILKHQ